MNYLAHAYLSFEQPEILLGNMISDYVKGKQKFGYPLLQNGIALHRAIDTFTDAHPVIGEAKEIFRPAYRLYSGAVVDVVFDHFLATDTNHFTLEQLKGFATTTYRSLQVQEDFFPERFQRMFPYMQQQNWLYNYHHRQAIDNSLHGLVRRAAYLTESETAFRLFEQHYEELREYYNRFFPELYRFTNETYLTLLNE
jgi:acyl carrier protein phosphodiesterase